MTDRKVFLAVFYWRWWLIVMVFWHELNLVDVSGLHDCEQLSGHLVVCFASPSLQKLRSHHPMLVPIYCAPCVLLLVTFQLLVLLSNAASDPLDERIRRNSDGS